MDQVAAQQLRQNWRASLDNARFNNHQVIVMYHDIPVAVLVPPGWWERAVRQIGTPAGGLELGVRAGRTELHERLSAARAGQYTIIRNHSDPAGVLVPCDWHQRASAALADTEQTDSPA